MRYFYIASIFFMQLILNTQTYAEQDVSTFRNQLKAQYKTIKQPGLDKMNIKPDDIYPLIELIKSNSSFEVKQVGSSFLERPIYKIKIGNGPRKIFIWSQMHGNEPTATASLFDFINYIDADENKAWVDGWKDQVTLHMVPMVNPDGADMNQRYNAQSIDINRDAKRLQTSEGRMLAGLADEIQPEFGFNLHDQGRFYTTGSSANTATISILAPAFNDAKDIGESRHKAMQLIGLLNDSIQQEIPNHVGRYDDTYAFRAFGDLFSSKGIATTLIESGHYPDDRTRQMPRWLTFMSLVQSVDVITSKSYEQETLEKYHSIPMNKSNGIVDVLLKNVHIEDSYTVDISVNYSRYFKRANIKEIGDLSANHGLLVKDFSQYKLKAVKGYKVEQAVTLTTEVYLKLLSQGFGYFEGDKKLIDNQSNFPIMVNPKNIATKVPQRHQQASFLFTRNDKVELAMINGTIIEL